MSNHVENCMEALVQAILNSEEYKDYLYREEELNKNPELRRKVDEFRNRNFQLQKQEGIDLFEAVDQLDQEYAELQSDASVNAYLEAELAICKILQKIHGELIERVPISVPEGL